MPTKLQQATERLAQASADVAHEFLEAQLQQAIPGTEQPTADSLDVLVKNTYRCGAIPALLGHPTIKNNLTETSKVLGISRDTLRKFIKQLDITNPTKAAT